MASTSSVTAAPLTALSACCPDIHCASPTSRLIVHVVNCDYCDTITPMFDPAPDQGCGYNTTSCPRCLRRYSTNTIAMVYELYKKCWACGDEVSEVDSRRMSLVMCPNPRCLYPYDGTETFLWRDNNEFFRWVNVRAEIDMETKLRDWKWYNKRLETRRVKPLIKCAKCGKFMKGESGLGRHEKFCKLEAERE